MGKKRAIRDFLIIIFAVIGVFALTFGITLIKNSTWKIIAIVIGAMLILISIIISLTRLLMK